MRSKNSKTPSIHTSDAHLLPGPAVELRHLRYFVAAAEYGSFRQAGAAIDVEQSAISRRIRDLEDRLGASLFHRHSSGVCLTFAGNRFLGYARKALRQIGNGARFVESVGRVEAGHLRIGIFSSLASGFLSDLLRRFHRSHADIRIDFIDGDPAEHVVAVRRLRLDVAFVTGIGERDGCETTPLWSERVFGVLPTDHRLAARRELSWQDIALDRFIVSDAAPGPEIHDYLVQRLADFGQQPSICQQYVGRDNLLTLVAHGSGLTVTSEATTAVKFPGVVYLPIAGEKLPFCAVWSRHNDNPAFRRLLSVARSASTVPHG